MKSTFLVWLSHGPLAIVLPVLWLASLPALHYAFKHLRCIQTVGSSLVRILLALAELVLTVFTILSCSHAGCAREVRLKTRCTQNLREIAIAFSAYTQDWDERFPPAGKWMDAAKKYLPPEKANQVFTCPSALSPFGYAFNSALSSLPLTQVTFPAETVMVFECDAKKPNAHGGLKDLPQTPRHLSEGDNYAFVDCHTQWRRRIFATSLRWNP
ncbi:MAG: hypothetical protein N3B10_10765 [Armatimonadetes bacterium]|nr:hypothetical protein [Armatimonadota bacterium]